MQHKNSNRMLEKVSEDGEKERERARERKWKWKCWSLSHVQLFTWNVARQAPLSMEFSRQEFWSGKFLLCSAKNSFFNIDTKCQLIQIT